MSVLDPEIALQLREDLPAEVFATIVATFEADSARLLTTLEAAVAAGNGAAFHRAAHTLAGAAGAVGARDLAATARRGMKAAGNAEQAPLLPLLRAQAGAAAAELHALAGAAP